MPKFQRKTNFKRRDQDEKETMIIKKRIKMLSIRDDTLYHPDKNWGSSYNKEKAVESTVGNNNQKRFEGDCHIARHMIKAFGRRPWMEDFIDKEGNNLKYKGE